MIRRQSRHCIYTGDDCIAGHYIEDAVIENCLINSSCNGVRLIGPARRLTFAHCEFFGPGRFEHRTSRDLHRTNMPGTATSIKLNDAKVAERDKATDPPVPPRTNKISGKPVGANRP